MDALVEILLEYGYAGMFVAALLSGSVVPFSSELVMLGLLQVGLNPLYTIVAGTLGNSLGSMTCYWMGLLGNLHWVERLFHVKPEQLERAKRYVQRRGTWIAFFCFLPTLGTVLGIALGMMRANGWLAFFYMTLGKLLRYILLVYTSELIF